MTRANLVFDVGKTNAKLIAIDANGAVLRELRHANRVLSAPPYPHIDVDAQWDFLIAGLAEMTRHYEVDGIIPVTHGATAAVTDAAGQLVLPVLDYEAAIPDPVSATYDTIRPAFSETASPGLPNGLNLGRQLFWLARAFPDAFAKTRAILTFPQYWSFRLTGTFASEVTSLGCHTDLWAPDARDFSSLVDRLEWRPLFPGLKRADAVLGHVDPKLCNGQSVRVLSGLHDSNASFLPHLVSSEGAFSVLSTGTWVIAMAGKTPLGSLTQHRDTLANCDVFGHPVPTARFMGGREYELLAPKGMVGASVAIEELLWVIDQGGMILPNQGGEGGPFPGRRGTLIGGVPDDPRKHHALVLLYLALMADRCLDLIGASGPLTIEGPFARNRAFAQLLSGLRGQKVNCADGQAGTTAGAHILLHGEGQCQTSALSVRPAAEIATALRAYRWKWCEVVLG